MTSEHKNKRHLEKSLRFRTDKEISDQLLLCLAVQHFILKSFYATNAGVNANQSKQLTAISAEGRKPISGAAVLGILLLQIETSMFMSSFDSPVK